MQWETPELQYPGNITRYEIHLGKKALQPDKEKKNIDIITNDVRSFLFGGVQSITDENDYYP